MDDREFGNAVDLYGDMVYRIALNQMRNAADAEDIVQSVFLKLYTKASEDVKGERLKHWLIRVAANECNSVWRSLWKRRIELRDVAAEESLDSDEFHDNYDGRESHHNHYERESGYPKFSNPDYSKLYDALACLPKKCRMVVHLFYFEDYSTAEIARILEIREPTVRTRLVRARKLLKQQLEEVSNDVRSEALSGNDGRSSRSWGVAG